MMNEQEMPTMSDFAKYKTKYSTSPKEVNCLTDIIASTNYMSIV